jgi:hypothetical protein
LDKQLHLSKEQEAALNDCFEKNPAPIDPSYHVADFLAGRRLQLPCFRTILTPEQLPIYEAFETEFPAKFKAKIAEVHQVIVEDEILKLQPLNLSEAQLARVRSGFPNVLEETVRRAANNDASWDYGTEKRAVLRDVLSPEQFQRYEELQTAEWKKANRDAYAALWIEALKALAAAGSMAGQAASLAK